MKKLKEALSWTGILLILSYGLLGFIAFINTLQGVDLTDVKEAAFLLGPLMFFVAFFTVYVLVPALLKNNLK